MANWVTLQNGVHIDLDDPNNPITGSGSYESYFKGGKASTSKDEIFKSASMARLKNQSPNEIMNYIKGQKFTLQEEGKYMDAAERKSYQDRIDAMQKIYDAKTKGGSKNGFSSMSSAELDFINSVSAVDFDNETKPERVNNLRSNLEDHISVRNERLDTYNARLEKYHQKKSAARKNGDEEAIDFYNEQIKMCNDDIKNTNDEISKYKKALDIVNKHFPKNRIK